VTDRTVQTEPGPNSSRWRWLTGHPRRLDAVVALQIFAQAIVLYVLVHGGFFYGDDFINLRLAQIEPLGPHYLLTSNFQHLEPGVRFEYWLVAHVIGLHYEIVSGMLVVLIGLLTWVVYRTLRLLFQPSVWMLALTLMLGLWVGWLGAATWLASAFEVVPSALACTITVYAFCRRLESGGDLWIAISAAAFAMGLAFYEGTMVILPSLVLITAALAVDRRSTSSWRALARRAVAPFLWYVTAATAFIAVFLSRVAVPVGKLPSLIDLVDFVWNSWSRAFVPSLFGGPVQWAWTGPRGVGAAPLWWVLTSEVLLLVALAVSLERTRGRAAFGWALVILPYVLLIGLVGWARFHEYGLTLGQDYQYQVDVLVPATVGFGFITMGRRGRPALRWTGRVPVRLVSAGLVAAYLYSLALSSIPAGNRWSASPTRPYLNNLRLSVTELGKSAPGRWSLYDTAIPLVLVFAAAWPFNSVASFAQLFSLRAPIDVSGTDVYVVDAAGKAVPARFQVNRLAVSQCATAQGSIDVRVKPALPPGVWTVRVVVPGHPGGVVGMAVSSSTLSALSGVLASKPLDSPGDSALLSLYWPSPVRWLNLAVEGTHDVCASSVEIGKPVPDP